MGRGPQYPGDGPALDQRAQALDFERQLLYPVPSWQFPVVAPPDGISVFLEVGTQQAGFHAMQQARLERVVNEGLGVWIVAQSDDATVSGEVRLTMSGPAGTRTAATTIVGLGGVATVKYRWRHGYPLWDDGGQGVLVTIEGRCTAFSPGRFFRVYPSFGGVEQIDPRGCTATGL